MGLLDFLKKGKVQALETEVLELKRLAYNNFQSVSLQNIAASINSNLAIYPKNDLNSYADRYCTTDDIYSLVKRLAETAALIPIYAYLVKDEQAQKKLNKIKRPHTKFYEAKHLQLKALEDLQDTDRVELLMEQPCTGMSKAGFYEYIYSFLFLSGEVFIRKERPGEGVNKGFTTNLEVLYPQGVTIKVTDTLPRKVLYYDYRIGGKIVYENIPAEDVIHIKYFNPKIDYNGSELRGLSPLEVLSKRLARLDSNMDTSVAQMQNGGVRKIVFDKSLVGTESKKAIQILDAWKENIYRFIKHPGNAGSPYLAGGEMGVIDIGSTLNEMGVINLENIDFKKLCNAYGTSDILFNSDVASTESNVTVMEKRTYTNTVLPNVYRVRDALKLSLLEEFEKGVNITTVNPKGELKVIKIKGDGIKRDLREDISEIPSLQEDMGKMVTWQAQAWWITPNEKREMMKFDKLDDPLFDEPLIPMGVQTIEDLELPEPVEQVTEEGN